MARDVLAIPITIVASESTFSIGGQILDEYRSCLKSNAVEVLICTRDWLFGYGGNDYKPSFFRLTFLFNIYMKS